MAVVATLSKGYGARGPIQLYPGDLAAVDEASMVGNPDLADVISQAADSGAKVILAGETQQPQAVESGAACHCHCWPVPWVSCS